MEIVESLREAFNDTEITMEMEPNIGIGFCQTLSTVNSVRLTD